MDVDTDDALYVCPRCGNAGEPETGDDYVGDWWCPTCGHEWNLFILEGPDDDPDRPLEDDEFQAWHDEPGYCG